MTTATMAPAAKLVWYSTARRETTALGLKKVWRTKCDRYQVTTFAEGRGDFSAWYREGEFFRLISRHRKSGTAVEACCSHAKRIGS